PTAPMYPRLAINSPSSFFSTLSSSPVLSTLSLHDALPILRVRIAIHHGLIHLDGPTGFPGPAAVVVARLLNSQPVRQVLRQDVRSEEHTSELQSRRDLVCRLLLEKKKYT